MGCAQRRGAGRLTREGLKDEEGSLEGAAAGLPSVAGVGPPSEGHGPGVGFNKEKGMCLITDSEAGVDSWGLSRWPLEALTSGC